MIGLYTLNTGDYYVSKVVADKTVACWADMSQVSHNPSDANLTIPTSQYLMDINKSYILQSQRHRTWWT